MCLCGMSLGSIIRQDLVTQIQHRIRSELLHKTDTPDGTGVRKTKMSVKQSHYSSKEGCRLKTKITPISQN